MRIPYILVFCTSFSFLLILFVDFFFILGRVLFEVLSSAHAQALNFQRNRPFAVYDHMVQKPPCWRANYPLGHPKQKNIKLSCFVLDVPVGSLLSSMAVFVPCDCKLQRAYLVYACSNGVS